MEHLKISEIFYDIRKLYEFRTPCRELMDYIEFFSETSLEATARFIPTERFVVSLFPSFTPTIWINLGAPYDLFNGKNTKRIGEKDDILVLRSTTLERNNFSSDNIFTIKFNPLGFESIFGISQANIGDDIVNASHILPKSVIKKLKEPVGLYEKSHFLENFFLNRLAKNSADRHHLQCINRSIHLHHADMRIKLSDMASQLCVSEKTFNRYFHQIIGTNPKHFFDTTRCRLSLTTYKKNPKKFSPFDFGYYDFSHFSKEVKRFTGASLTSSLT